MASARSAKDKAMASYLRHRHIVRNAGACPWGCGSLITNGGEALLSHLSRCVGNRRYDRRVRRSKV